MKKLKLAGSLGFSQIFVLLGMLLVAISLPVATKLVQENQESRSSAATTGSTCSSSYCSGGSYYRCSGGKVASIIGCTYGKCIGSSRCMNKSEYEAENAATPKPPTATPTKKPTTSTYTYYYYNGSKCVSASYSATSGSEATSKCNTAHGNCYTSSTMCSAQNSSATKYTFYYGSTCKSGSYTSASACATAVGSVCYSLKSSCESVYITCAAKYGSGYECATPSTCYGTIKSVDGTTCSGVCCKLPDAPTATPTLSSYCGCYAGNSQGVTKMTSYDTETKCKAAGFNWITTGCSSTHTVTSTGTNGACGALNNTCTKGNLSDTADTNDYYVWVCKGIDGGLDKTCTLDKSPTCSSSNCSDCTAASACSAAGCYWETQLKVCTDNPNNVSDTTPSTGGGNSSGGGSGTGGGSTITSIPATAIVLSPTSLNLKIGESEVVVVTLTPINSTDKVTWSSDHGTIATVNANGVITGVKLGETIIRAVTDSDIEATVKVKVISDDALTLSFKVAFAGIKPIYKNSIGSTYSCIGSLGDLTVEILNRPTNTYKSFSDIEFAVLGNEVDSKGNQVFQVTNMEVGSEFASVNAFNNVKIKGPFHLKRRMCLDGQSGKLDETTTCNINLSRIDSYVYDFSEYTLLAGDVNQDGVINGIDFSLVKNAVNADAEPYCGRQYDLNMDGVVNSLDLNLVKDSLSSRDDE